MTPPLRLLPLLLLLALVVPGVVGENVTYPQEYYDLNANATTEINTINPYLTYDYHPVLAIWHKLNAIQIAIEKNNELVAENNALLREQKNATLKCIDTRAIQINSVCKEYAWVGGA